MTIDLNILQKALCHAMCSEIRIREKTPDLLAIDTPFSFPDGDQYQLYIKVLPWGVLRLTDMGHTLMHLSYENDIDKFREGTRGTLFEQIKMETSVDEHNGSFFIDSTIENLCTNIFHMGQAITKINDLTFLKRSRAESTFYEDLKESLYMIVPPEKIVSNFLYEGIENAIDYPIDYRIEGKENLPVFLFGIPNKDKAKLVTIILERLLRAHANYDSLLVFLDQGALPRPDLARLTNAGGEMIASLDAEQDFRRKLQRKVQMN